jgi:multisubunit Na+/H+ antiporter MnhC subunit
MTAMAAVSTGVTLSLMAAGRRAERAVPAVARES